MENHELVDYSIYGVAHAIETGIIEQTLVPLYTFQPLKLLRVQYSLDMLHPVGRSGHRIVATDSHLYCLGGYNPDFVLRNVRTGYSALFEELWAYNMARKNWKLMISSGHIEDFPTELVSHGLVKCNNAVISHGGTCYPFADECSHDTTVFNFHGEASIERIAVTGELPPKLYGMAIVLHQHYLYTIGGTSGRMYTCDVHRLNLNTAVWQHLYNGDSDRQYHAPIPRYRHEMGYDGNYIYVLGGAQEMTTFGFERIAGFNLTTNTWKTFDTLPDLLSAGNNVDGFPKPRKSFSSAQHNASTGDVEVFIMGGILQGTDIITEYLSDIWRLNLRTKQWTCIAESTMQGGLYFHAAAATPNISCMYVFGGIRRMMSHNEPEDMRCNHLYKFWMQIPKLTDICWEAMQYYFPYLHRADPKKLLKEGIPKYLVDRLSLSSSNLSI